MSRPVLPHAARAALAIALALVSMRLVAFADETPAGPASQPTASPGSPGPTVESSATRAAWDLLSLVAAAPSAGSRARIIPITNFGEQRRSLALPIPERVAYPAEIPPNAALEFGYAIQARIFSVDFLPKAGPTRFKVVFRSDDGTETVLHERTISPRDSASDRRWFDERIDLAALAGKRGTLAFSVERADDPAKPAETTALFSAPRIVANATPKDVNVLFITIDCLRADHVGANGYQRPTTPAIDRIAAEGVRFARAYTSAPMTLPSLPQILTSSVFPEPGSKSLAHPLAAAGVPSAAIVNNVWLVLWMSRNATPFDTIVSGDLMAEQLTDAALAWLDRHARSRFALYLHYLDAHTPYHGPRSYARRFADPDYSGPIGDEFGDVAAANNDRYDARDKQRIVALYDGQVRYIDDQLARIFDYLREKGLLDKTVIAISADHGEEFWDHGRFFHGQSLYDELLHVPLIVRLPGGAHAGTVVQKPVRSIDTAPALLEWAGLPRPASFTGRSLAEAIAAPDAPPDDLIATATMGQFPTRYGIRTPEAKLVDTVDDGRRQLFDLAQDPGERHDASKEELERTAALAQKLGDARRPLEQSGMQIRIVGPRTGKARFRLVLASLSRNGVFETVDRTQSADGTRVSLSSDGRRLEVYGEIDARGVGVRADRRLLLLAALGGKPDPIRAVLTVDGERAAPDRVLLGQGRPLPASRRFEAGSPELAAPGPPDCAAPDQGVRVCLWNAPATRPQPTPVTPPVADGSARERLRALGYVQ